MVTSERDLLVRAGRVGEAAVLLMLLVLFVLTTAHGHRHSRDGVLVLVVMVRWCVRGRRRRPVEAVGLPLPLLRVLFQTFVRVRPRHRVYVWKGVF